MIKFRNSKLHEKDFETLTPFEVYEFILAAHEAMGRVGPPNQWQIMEDQDLLKSTLDIVRAVAYETRFAVDTTQRIVNVIRSQDVLAYVWSQRPLNDSETIKKILNTNQQWTFWIQTKSKSDVRDIWGWIEQNSRFKPILTQSHPFLGYLTLFVEKDQEAEHQQQRAERIAMMQKPLYQFTDEQIAQRH